MAKDEEHCDNRLCPGIARCLTAPECLADERERALCQPAREGEVTPPLPATGEADIMLEIQRLQIAVERIEKLLEPLAELLPLFLPRLRAMASVGKIADHFRRTS